MASVDPDSQQQAVPLGFRQIASSELSRERRLGGGGFGEVWLGRWASAQHAVAIKLLPDSRSWTDSQRQLFINECSAMARLAGLPYIVAFHGACVEPGECCIVMEYHKAGSLRDVLDQSGDGLHLSTLHLSTLHLSTKIKLAYQMAKSINFLHNDIKSHNFLVDDNLNAKVTDFGLAIIRREVSQRGSPTAPDAGYAGSLPWMAPDYLTSLCYSDKCDVYSLGVVFWELATPELPFGTHRSSESELKEFV
jgi:serine/threonine protein kinase